MIERLWVEVNNRLNYSVKDALVQMADSGVLIWMTIWCALQYPGLLCEPVKLVHG